MSEFSFPEVAEDARHEHTPEPGASEPGTLALSADEFSALEERILRAVNLVKRERLAKSAAEERAAAAEARIADQIQAGENLNRERENLQRETANLQKEIDTLRAERDQVRQRVERLLSQLDALEA
jgi:chromosome segregation ATPase